ncbi:MAG TPA: peptide transporter, partial [Rhodospirillum rubrum]|nr:peptide transporter [Rhodospirillum rubrum]
MAGDIDDLTHLGPLLASEGVDRRITVNLMAAKAFLAEGRPDQALICAERLFRLSGWQPAVAPVLLSILDGMGAVARATEVRKIACLSACKAGDFALVRRLYLDWRYHHVAVLGREVFDADPCVIEGLDRLAERLRPPGETPGGGRAPRQTPRVLYVLSSVTQEGSVLAKLMAGLLTHHDASRCEVGVAIADADQRAFEESAEGRQVRTVATLRGWTTFVASEAGIEARLRALRARVIDWAPDLLVTNAALAQPEAYLLVRSLDIPWVAQVVGPPAQFTAPGAVFNLSLI